jgi:hypothetical protein
MVVGGWWMVDGGWWMVDGGLALAHQPPTINPAERSKNSEFLSEQKQNKKQLHKRSYIF